MSAGRGAGDAAVRPRRVTVRSRHADRDDLGHRVDHVRDHAGAGAGTQAHALTPLGRAPYAVAGLALSGVKLTLDRYLSEFAFHRPWTPAIYLAPLGRGARLGALNADERDYLLALVALALPFVALGTWLTLRRLRSAGWSPWLVLLFFVPLVNLGFFAALCIAPPRSPRSVDASPPPAWWRRWLPASDLGAALVSTLLTAVLGTAFVAFATRVLADYGWSVFVALPFAQGLLAVWLIGARSGRVPTVRTTLGVALLSLALTGGLLAAFLVEGLICLALAAPLAIPLVLAGALAGRAILTLPPTRAGALLVAALALPVGALGAVPSPALDAPRYAVVTRIVVDAPPARVWPHVIAFAPLPPPTEPLFLAGIAYPQRAHIAGAGQGAIRYCEFSTGAFVEPITVWDAPRRLAFGVTRNPPPMREFSLYGAALDTPHLTNYLVADAGEFRLNALPNGRTELIGTTWYRHHLYPAAYWRLWSDAIIHRIHLRVLEHIARLSTTPA